MYFDVALGENYIAIFGRPTKERYEGVMRVTQSRCVIWAGLVSAAGGGPTETFERLAAGTQTILAGLGWPMRALINGSNRTTGLQVQVGA